MAKNDSPDETVAAEALASARAQLVEAQERAAEAASGLTAVVTRNLPPIPCVVLDDNTMTHDGKHYGAGDPILLDGPTAIAMVQQGHVKIQGAD